MRQSLLWKLLGINLLVICFVTVIVWIAIDYLAAGYFVTLMKKYNINPVSGHKMFLDSIHRYLITATISAVLLATALSYLLTKRVLGPLTRMADITKRITAGDYTGRIPIRGHDEVGQLAEAFNRMTESLKAIENLRKNMMIDVAHELRTPLTNIQGYLEALLDEVIPPSKQHLELLLEESLRLADLVESILSLAKADAARTNLHIAEIDISKMLTDSLETFLPQFLSKEITVAPPTGAGVVTVRADPGKLSQVVNNLLQNAAQYADRGGFLRIRTETDDDEIRILFTNSGGGLSEQDLPFIFERFYRAEKSRSRELGGAGIGLAIVKELIEAHNGKVGAEVSNGETTVWFSLPT